MSRPKVASRRQSDNSAGERTRQNLMLAAEELVAEGGLGGVSAREIARKVGLKNNVSVQYHFKSIENLLDQAVLNRMMMLDEIRAGLINETGDSSLKSLPLESLWRIVCFPQLTIVGKNGQYQYAQFLCNYLPVARPEGFSWIIRTSSENLPALRNVLQQMRQMLSDLPLDAFHRRVTSANLLFLNACRGLRPDNDLPVEANPVARDAFRQSLAALTISWIP